MKEAALFAVVYDISDNRERYCVDRVLKGYGFRVQKSVFECRLGKADKSRLIGELVKLSIVTVLHYDLTSYRNHTQIHSVHGARIVIL